MPDRPKPPAGYGTWAEWCLTGVAAWIGPQAIAYALEELKELRNELELFKATAKQEEAVHVFTTT